MPPRNPKNDNLTLYEHFYLPDFGAFGPTEFQNYNDQRERLDQFIREIFDNTYSLPHVLAQKNDPPDMSWFYELQSIPHWRVARGFWKYEEQAGDTFALDSSLFGHDGGTRYTCQVRQQAGQPAGHFHAAA
jgi:hypothetical protein